MNKEEVGMYIITRKSTPVRSANNSSLIETSYRIKLVETVGFSGFMPIFFVLPVGTKIRNVGVIFDFTGKILNVTMKKCVLFD